MFIRSDQTGSARGKNVVLDDIAPPRMIESKNSEVGVQKVDERKRKLSPKPKPTVKQLLDKYTSQKADNIFNRLRGNKRLRSPSRHGGHEPWREKSFNRQTYFPMAAINWGCRPPVYPQYPQRASMHVFHILQGQHVIFCRIGFHHRDLCTNHTCKREELRSTRKFGQMKLF
jgi:hypothetical protein